MWGSRICKRKRSSEATQHSLEELSRKVRKKFKCLEQSRVQSLEKLKASLAEAEEKRCCLAPVAGSGGGAGVNPREGIRARMARERECLALRSEIARLESKEDLKEFVDRVRPLAAKLRDAKALKQMTFVDQQQLNKLYHNVFRNEAEEDSSLHFVESDACSSCGQPYVFKSQESMMVCDRCGNACYVMDSTNDYVDKKPVKTSSYTRAPNYKKYLLQFHEKTQDPPQEVINTILTHLNKVHVMLPCKYKCTPIAQILRDQKMHKWSHHAVRISKIITGQPVVKLSDEVIERLLYRFNRMMNAFHHSNGNKKKKKIMNFEFLTKQFLYMENLGHLAACFENHKTREVLIDADRRLWNFSKTIDTSDGTSWHVVRSC